MKCPRNGVRVNARKARGDISLDYELSARPPLNLFLFQLIALASLVVHFKDAAIPDMPDIDLADLGLWLVTVGGNLLPVF